MGLALGAGIIGLLWGGYNIISGIIAIVRHFRRRSSVGIAGGINLANKIMNLVIGIPMFIAGVWLTIEFVKYLS